MLWSLALTALLAAFATAQQPETNLLADGGFEGVAENTGQPRGWYFFRRPTTGYRASLVEDGRSGHAVRLEGEGEYGGVGSPRQMHDASRIYAARAWVKFAAPDSEAFLKLDYQNEQGMWVASSREVRLRGGPGEWQPLSLYERAWEAPPGTARVALVCGIRGKSDLLFDDAELVLRDGGARDNLLADGSMEVTAGGEQSRWRMAQAPGGMIRKVRRSVPVRDGWFCVELAGKAQWAVTETDAVEMQPARRYVLTGWVRARQGRGALKQAQERAGAERTAYLHGFGVGRELGMQEGSVAACPRQPRNSKGQFVKATESK